MRHKMIRFAKVLGLAMLLAVDARAAAPSWKNEGAEGLVGDWRGESVCVVKASACHDEDSLYHVAKLEKKPGWFSLQGDKIVDGKPVNMGTVECSFDAAKSSLECRFPRGFLELQVEPDRMRGTMKLPDGTLWRKLSLKKVP